MGQETDTAAVAVQDSADFKSGYEDVAGVGGNTSVGQDLKDDDLLKNSVLKWDVAHDLLADSTVSSAS